MESGIQKQATADADRNSNATGGGPAREDQKAVYRHQETASVLYGRAVHLYGTENLLIRYRCEAAKLWCRLSAIISVSYRMLRRDYVLINKTMFTISCR